jgi:ribosomal protein L16 Arg81 hydroxylase
MHDTVVVEPARRSEESAAPLGFADILAPVLPAQFLEEYWAKRPLHIGGSTRKFAGLMDHKDFVRCSAHVDALQAYIANHDRTGHAAIVGILPRQIKAMYVGGFTICAKGLEKGLPILAELARRMKAELHYSGDVDFRGYLSRHGSGAPLHFDARHATTLQLEGTKTWRFAAGPSVPYPPRNAVSEDGTAAYADVDPQPRVSEFGLEPSLLPPPPVSELTEVTLRPGDVLYLPPGTWHSARAVGHSLAVNMAFNYTKGGTAIELMSDILYRLLYADPAWRATLPVFVEAQNDAMPEAVRQFLDERLDDVRRALTGLTASDSRIDAVWRRRIRS